MATNKTHKKISASDIKITGVTFSSNIDNKNAQYSFAARIQALKDLYTMNGYAKKHFNYDPLKENGLKQYYKKNFFQKNPKIIGIDDQEKLYHVFTDDKFDAMRKFFKDQIDEKLNTIIDNKNNKYTAQDIKYVQKLSKYINDRLTEDPIRKENVVGKFLEKSENAIPDNLQNVVKSIKKMSREYLRITSVQNIAHNGKQSDQNMSINSEQQKQRMSVIDNLPKLSINSSVNQKTRYQPSTQTTEDKDFIITRL